MDIINVPLESLGLLVYSCVYFKDWVQRLKYCDLNKDDIFSKHLSIGTSNCTVSTDQTFSIPIFCIHNSVRFKMARHFFTIWFMPIAYSLKFYMSYKKRSWHAIPRYLEHWKKKVLALKKRLKKVFWPFFDLKKGFS